MIRLATIVAGVLVAAAPHAAAQGFDGYISATVDVFPAVRQESGARSAFSELRARLFAERTLDIGEHWRVTLAGFAEGLVADRGRPDTVTDLAIEAQEAHLEGRWPHADLRSRLEPHRLGPPRRGATDRRHQPVGPDPVLLRGPHLRPAAPCRWFVRGGLPSDRLPIEGVYVPWFRRARFDELDDESSAFNLSP